MLSIRTLLVCLAILVGSTSSLVAQGLTPKDLDARIEKQLFDVLKLGTDIYNRGSQDACYRLYQGSLMSIYGFLEHRPDSQTKIKKALNLADGTFNVSERAFTLRTAIDELREAIKVTHTPGENAGNMPIVPSRNALWNRIGGELTATLVMEELTTRVLKNPRINFTRRGTGEQWDANPENVSKLKKQLITWFSSVTGGPLKYEGKDMRAAHHKLKIADAEFDLFMKELKESLDKYFVSPDEQKEILRLFEAQRKDVIDTTIAPRSLWDRLGGEAAVTLIVDDFVARAARNPAVNFTRKGLPNEWTPTAEQLSLLKKRLVAFVSSASNGPLKYDGKAMKEAHAGMKISDTEFNALVMDLKKSLDQYKIPDVEQNELINTVMSLKKDIVEKK